MSRGAYTVEWRVTSIDGHVVADEYGFEVAEEGEPASQPAEQEGGTTSVAAYGAASLGVLAVAILAVWGVIALRRRTPRH